MSGLTQGPTDSEIGQTEVERMTAVDRLRAVGDRDFTR